MAEKTKKPIKMPVMVDVWKCEDLKELIREKIKVHVKDVDLAKRLEHALADEIAYGDGGGGGVGIA
jgi:hypothetical protein